jgi:hypothetical protein
MGPSRGSLIASMPPVACGTASAENGVVGHIVEDDVDSGRPPSPNADIAHGWIRTLLHEIETAD